MTSYETITSFINKNNTVLMTTMEGTEIKPILNSKYKFIKVIHEERVKLKRPSSHEGVKQEIAEFNLKTKFNPDSFNFLKIPNCEIICQNITSEENCVIPPSLNTHSSDKSSINIDEENCGIPSLTNTHFSDKSLLNTDSPIIINPNPLAHGHCLLVPFIQECLSQYFYNIDQLSIGLHWLDSIDSIDFKLLYNSIGSYASVNHFHWHGVFLKGNRECQSDTCRDSSCGHLFLDGFFPVEYFGTSFPTRPIVIESTCKNDFIHKLYKIIQSSQSANIPFSLMISKYSPNGELYRGYLFERQIQKPSFVNGVAISGEHAGVHFAVVESCGYIICFDRDTFNQIESDEDVYDMLHRDYLRDK